jgi:hypothetical protein
VAQGKVLTTKIEKTKSWPQPVRPMPPISLTGPIHENLQSVNLTTPLCRAHRGDKFPYFICLNWTLNAKDMNFGSFQIFEVV